MITYNSVEQLIQMARKENKKLSELILEDQALSLEKSKEEVYNQMSQRLSIMEQSVKKGTVKGLKSVSGLSGGDAYKMSQYLERGQTLCGEVFGTAMIKALAAAEQNACMGKVCAAPTAGSCGIVPAVLLTVMEERKIPREDVVMALFTASGIGMVIANRASISGAEGGCQAECGAASAMAAAALTELVSGTLDMAGHATAISLKNILGLVCDPVAGLVEVPCIKRNAMGAANAFVGAELALAGIESKIPVDEVILAMKQVGDAIPASLKETSRGGLAITKTGLKYKKAIMGEE